MTVELMRAPFPLTYRELYLPRGIKGWAGPLPSSRYNGHELTFTGARHGTTVDGVHFTGAADSNINCGAIHNAAAKLWVSFRFKLDADYAAGAASDLMFFGKFIGIDDRLIIYLASGDGMLYFVHVSGGAAIFVIASTENSWNAGQWYHVLASLSDTVPAQRLIIENGIPVTDTAAAVNIPNGGDFVIGDQVDPGAGVGCKGVIADFCCEEGVDLTANEEADLYRGISPFTVDNKWLLDEGRGVTAYDRGADGNDGTLDTTATWAWGRVKQPVISFDGLNDVATGAVGANINGAITLVWAGKLKAHYDGVLDDHYFVEYWIDATHYCMIYLNSITGDVRFLGVSAGTNIACDLEGFGIEIDDYAIFIATLTAGGVGKLYANGRLHSVDAGVTAFPAGGAIAYIGAEDSPAYYDVSKPLLVGLIDGVFDQHQVLAYSRFLDRIFNLGVVT